MFSSLKLPNNEIGQALAGFRGAFRSVGVFSAIINLLMLVPSLYMLQVYDRVLSSRNETTLIMLTVMVLGTYMLMNGLEFVRSFVLIRVGAQLDMKLNKRVYTASFEQNLKKSGGNAGQALQDLTTIRQFLTGNSLFAFFDAPWFPMYLLVIFLFDWILGVFAVGGTIILVILAYVNEVVSRKPLAEANGMAVTAGTLATNNLRNAEVIQAMGMLPNLMSRWFKLHGRFLQLQAEASEKAGIVTATSKFVRISLQSLILGLGALLALENRITPGMMIVGSILMGRALAPVDQLINVWKGWSSTRSAYQRLSELLASNPARREGMPLPKPLGNLSLEGVTAVPPGSNMPALRNLSLTVAAGDVVGVIGPSGSGKSTLARLLVGVWPAAAGKVRLGNVSATAMYFATADYISMHNHDTGTSSDALYSFASFPSARKVAYFTPEIAGFTAEISHAFESATEAKANDLSVNYNAGDLQLGAGYTKQADVSQVGLRALYSMGALTVGGYLQRESVDGSANGKNRNIARLAAMYTMGANEFHVNVGHSDRGGSFAQKASQYTLGFNHNLTKRTKLYTYYTAINSPGKANDFNALAVGMRHNF